jgi:superfamily I DNA and RNA helicase
VASSALAAKSSDFRNPAKFILPSLVMCKWIGSPRQNSTGRELEGDDIPVVVPDDIVQGIIRKLQPQVISGTGH